MTRSRSSSRSRRPWWLVLLAAAVGWGYNTYFKAPPQRESTNRSARQPSSRQSSTSKRSSSGSTSRSSQPGRSGPTLEGGQVFEDVVIKVSDGDTVKLERHGSVRLIGVDCPEKAQPGGPEAGDFTRRALLGQTVRVELCAKQPTDRYGRYLGFIHVMDKTGRDVIFNQELVRQGYARVYSLRPCTVDEAEWNALYEEARAARRGLFGSLGEVPDAASYRRRKRS